MASEGTKGRKLKTYISTHLVFIFQSSGPQKEEKKKKGKKGKEEAQAKGGKQGARPQSAKGQGHPGVKSKDSARVTGPEG